MIDLNNIAEFSRNNCLAICGFLVPANLLATLQTVILVGMNRSRKKVWMATGIASIFAVTMVLHVWTWFAVGVVMAPTYILLCLGSTCLVINLWAIAHPSSLQRLLRSLYRLASRIWVRAIAAK
jgi:hypothetical protein